jgi:hypothetical protein
LHTNYHHRSYTIWVTVFARGNVDRTAARKRSAAHGKWEFGIHQNVYLKAGLKAICRQSSNPVALRHWGRAIRPGNVETFKSHTDPMIRSNEGRAFVIE